MINAVDSKAFFIPFLLARVEMGVGINLIPLILSLPNLSPQERETIISLSQQYCHQGSADPIGNSNHSPYDRTAVNRTIVPGLEPAPAYDHQSWCYCVY